MSASVSEFVYEQDPLNPKPANFPRQHEIPRHVPQDLIRDVGLVIGPEFLREPYEFMASLHQSQPPIFYNTSVFMNSWMAIKHEDILFILRHSDIFRNIDAAPFPRDPEDYFFFIPQEMDPPHHRKYRNIVDPVFSPSGIARLEETIRARAGGLIDAVLEKGECEFTTALGRPLPVSVFLDIMGLPQEMLPTFVEWGDTMIHSQDPAEVGMAFNKALSYLHTAIAEKKLNPDDGVISLIAHAEIDGRSLTDKEIFGFVTFLWIGGLDTVYATMNNMWLWLARNPERVQEIIERPEAINGIVEELLRRFSVTFSSRCVMKDVEVRGVQLKAGDRVMTVLPSGNFDPDVFPNPLEVDFNRPRKTILSFTAGVHSCMGSHLARLEIKVALQEWLKRIPRFTLKPDASIVYKPGGVVGPDSVPLVW